MGWTCVMSRETYNKTDNDLDINGEETKGWTSKMDGH